MGFNKPGNDNKPSQPPDIDEALRRLQAYLKRKFFTQSKPKQPNQPNPSSEASYSGGAFLILFLLLGSLLWALSGIFIVDPAEQAVILRFGRYVETVGPGPHWIPRFISTKVVTNVDRVSDYAYSANMLTQDENLVSVAIVVQYRIGDLEAYLFNAADPIESLQQATSSALRQVVGTTTLDKIITEGREAWGNRVQQSLISILNSYKTGIVVVNVSPQPARAPESVQEAFDDAIKAQEDEKRFKEQARAYEARVLPIAQGRANRILSEAKAFAQQVELQALGETAEFSALLPQYLQSPEVTSKRMYLETMQRVLSKSSKVIVDSKVNNWFSLPLDKWMQKTSSAAPQLPNQVSEKDRVDDKSAMPMLGDRNALSATERAGRGSDE